jgi:hypothetical protein
VDRLLLRVTSELRRTDLTACQHGAEFLQRARAIINLVNDAVDGYARAATDLAGSMGTMLGRA